MTTCSSENTEKQNGSIVITVAIKKIGYLITYKLMSSKKTHYEVFPLFNFYLNVMPVEMKS